MSASILSLFRSPQVRFRFPAAVLLVFSLLRAAFQVDSPASILLYVATWTIVLHVFLGAWVFIRYLRATSPLHQVLDLLAVLLMGLATLSIPSTPRWCVCFALVFTIAITKYLLCLKTDFPPLLHNYVREKVRLESPSVLLFSASGILARRYPEGLFVPLLVEGMILAASLLFAVYMIGIRRVYQTVVRECSDTGDPHRTMPT